MTKSIPVHKALGLTDDKLKELTADVLRKTAGTPTIMEALGSLKDTYDAEAMFVGMWIMETMIRNPGLYGQTNEQAFTEAFGDPHNAGTKWGNK